ncbi:MAG: hypothetical protein WCS27_00450 [Victivallaceae bacterium]
MFRILLGAIVFSCIFSLSAIEAVIPQAVKLPAVGQWESGSFKRALTLSGSGSVVLSRSGLVGEESGQPRPETFQVSMLHDGQNLALSARIQIPQNAELKAGKPIDGRVDHDDCLELFFVPDASRLNDKYQIMINSRGNFSVLSVTGLKIRKLNCPGLKAAAFVQPGFWNVQLTVPLTVFGLKPAKPFRFNAALTDRFRAKTARWSFAPLKKSFQEPENFITVKFGGAKTPSALYKSNPYTERLADGSFELGLDEWQCIGNVRTDNEYAYDGKNCLKFESKTSKETSRSSKTVPVTPGETLRIYGAVHLQALEQPNFSPLRVEFLDSAGKVVSALKAPGLKNMGGGTTRKHIFCDFTADVPEKAAKARLTWSLDGTSGIMRIDAVSVRRLYPQWKIPTLISPVYGRSFAKRKIRFVWSELASNKDCPIKYNLEIAANDKFDSGLIRVEGVYPGHKPELPGNGKWFWRIEVNKSGKKSFTANSEFTVFCTPENEKIPPEIISCVPFGLTPVRPKELVICFRDPAVSSGIDRKRVKLTVNGVDVSSRTKIFADKLVWPVPDNAENLFHYLVQVKDNNRNCGQGAGFFYVRATPPVISRDKQDFILRDGKRIFPLTFYGVPWYKTYPKMRQGGINANFSPWAADIDMIKHLQQAAQDGMYITPFAFNDEKILRGEVSPESASGKMLEAKKFERVLKLKDHPNTVGFYIGDEDLDGRGTLPEQAYRWYRKIKKAAPNQIVFWLPTWLLRDPARVKLGVGGCDYFIWHDYCYNQSVPLRFVSTYGIIKKATSDMPHIFIVEAFKNGPNGRLPTLEFLRFQCFFGIIERSRGLIFYASTRNWPDYLKKIFAVTGELNSLQEALVADDVRDLHRFVPASPPLRSVGKKVGDRFYVFIVNTGTAEYKGRIFTKCKKATLDGKPVSIAPDGGVELVLPSAGSALFKGTL